MGPENIAPLKFWIQTTKSLAVIAEALLAAGVISEFNCGCENVYEWFTSTPSGYNVELNVSRKHQRPRRDQPLGFMLIARDGSCPSEADVRDVAAKVRDGLNVPVNLGSIENVGDDDYNYIVVETL